MFARIRWHQVAKHWRPRDAACIATPASPPLPATDVAASRIYCPADDDLPVAPVPCHPYEMPEIRLPVSLWSLASTLCSGTKRCFAKLWHCWSIIQASLRCLSWLVPRSPREILQWPVQHKAPASSHNKVNLQQRLPRRLASMNTGSTRTSRTMTRGAALSRLSVSKRRARLSYWATVQTKRSEWLVSKETWIRRACRYLRANYRKGVALVKTVVRNTSHSLTQLWQCVFKDGEKDNHRARRRDAVTQQPRRWQQLSRAITVAVYTLGLECGRMFALPTWLRVISAYSAATIVPVLLPTAHGNDCRVATMMAATCLAGTRASLASAIGISIVLWLCPARALWWPTSDDTDYITVCLREVLKFMDAHEDVLPALHRPATTPAQKEETSLRNRYDKQHALTKTSLSDFTKGQRALQQKIDRRRTDQKICIPSKKLQSGQRNIMEGYQSRPEMIVYSTRWRNDCHAYNKKRRRARCCRSGWTRWLPPFT